jgi:2-polyprenyl-3-methyl-5-hydroxy-6-metoxy-1,4-benzoquinol methylase/glycosyltransferase involved in cell wall biosynthesis
MSEASIIMNPKKIAFFSKGDDKFIDNVIERLSVQFETKKITVRTQEQLKLIDQWMVWADICWFEWCDGLVAYGSKLVLAKNRIILCRLHSYEAFTNYPSQVNWSCVDRLIFVSEHIQKYVAENFKIDEEITIVIPNGVDINKCCFNKRSFGFKVAYVGYINYKKGPMLLLQTFKAIYDQDNRYKFYIAGRFQDPRYSLYFNQMVKEFGLENSFFFEGWQEDINQWLEDKNYILCTSVLESQNMSVMQAMAKGIKPIIHNFVGAKGIYEQKYLWNTIGEAVCMIEEESYDSLEYREFVEYNYSIEKQYQAICKMILGLTKEGNKIKDKEIKDKEIKDKEIKDKEIKDKEMEGKQMEDKKKEGFDYKEYWNKRLNSKFNIEGVGYIGLGEIYNQFLYQNRMDLLEGVVSKAFDDVKNKRVLELGPGTGMFTQYFYDKGVQVYDAIDIAEKSANELSSSYPNYHFKQGDICDSYPYEGQYDLIFAADVMLHITNENQYEKAINNISEHLSSNGLCILFDPISIIDTKSEANHVVIRDKEYVEKVLVDNELKLKALLPVAYFMNYPFDRAVIGNKGDKALALFNSIQNLFMDNSISNEDKKSIGEYLLFKEKQLLYYRNFGLSEKLLIIQKRGNSNSISYSLREIFNINSIKYCISEICLKLSQNENIQNNSFKTIDKLLNCLEEDEKLSVEYIQREMNEFISYRTDDFDCYDFSTAQIMLGKRERTIGGYELVEFILNNHQKIKLIFNNIWYDISKNKFILPEQMQKSIKSDKIADLAKGIIDTNLEFQNNIAGFIYDQSMKEDVSKNYLAYIWERGIPASQFLPILGYLKIAERYIFTASFMNKMHKVLEAPCGFGYGAAYLSKICSQVEALDIAEDNITFAKDAFRHQNIHWTKGDVTALPYNNDEFDVYVSLEVFEHLPIENTIKHIEEAYRVLKESGKFIISTPNRETRKNVNNPYHTKEYNFNELNEIITKVFPSVEFYSMSGFKVDKGMKETAYDMIAVCEK